MMSNQWFGKVYFNLEHELSVKSVEEFVASIKQV